MRCIVKKGNRELIGSKGLGLYKCQLLDVKVPEFYVIPTKYCMQFKGKKIGKPLANELKQVLKKLGGFVAVRSSSVVEDLETGSMAGQFKTVLNVDTYSGLLKAVRQVWASADGVAPNMAVIIQKQLKPDLAGVLFTRNPVNGKSETVIEYIPGLGDQLVSGKREPNRIVVKKGKDNK